jgi:hypothetical protein
MIGLRRDVFFRMVARALGADFFALRDFFMPIS